MPITRLGKGVLLKALIGDLTINFCSTGSCMIVGCSTAAHSATSSYLGSMLTYGLSTMESGYPSLAAFTATSTNATVTFRGEYGASEANGVWGEVGIYNATASGTDGYLLFRYVDNIGTKTCSYTWQLTGSLTLTT